MTLSTCAKQHEMVMTPLEGPLIDLNNKSSVPQQDFHSKNHGFWLHSCLKCFRSLSFATLTTWPPKRKRCFAPILGPGPKGEALLKLLQALRGNRPFSNNQTTHQPTQQPTHARAPTKPKQRKAKQATNSGPLPSCQPLLKNRLYLRERGLAYKTWAFKPLAFQVSALLKITADMWLKGNQEQASASRKPFELSMG